MTMLKRLFTDTLHLFYPHICTGCGSDLLPDKNLLCLKCINDLPHTNYAQHANNPIEKIFWGRIPLVAAHSEFYFAKESLVQHLIHQLKYKGNKDVGYLAGSMMGDLLLQSGRFNGVDALVPLPLFSAREKKRGYNQAAILCEGIAQALQVPVLNTAVERVRSTETQTRKNRVDRWQNIEGKFQLIFAATFIQYFKHKKPCVTVYLKNQPGNYPGKSIDGLQAAYQQHYDASKLTETEIDIQ